MAEQGNVNDQGWVFSENLFFKKSPSFSFFFFIHEQDAMYSSKLQKQKTVAAKIIHCYDAFYLYHLHFSFCPLT